MSPRLCSLLLALQGLMAAATPTLKTCKGGGEKEVQVDGWPVEVALRAPVMADITWNLSLMSHDQKEHTRLTLIHRSQQKTKVGMVEATLKTDMATSALNMTALMPDSAWVTLKISVRHKDMEMKINSETHSTKYSSKGSLDITRRLHVNKVACTGSSCNSYIDLQCRDGAHNHTKEHKPVPAKSIPDRGVYYWGFYVVIALLVMVCLLFVVWRRERNKFRNRWMRHSQTVRRMGSTSDEPENPNQTSVRNESSQNLAANGVGHSNPAYDHTGETDN